MAALAAGAIPRVRRSPRAAAFIAVILRALPAPRKPGSQGLVAGAPGDALLAVGDVRVRSEAVHRVGAPAEPVARVLDGRVGLRLDQHPLPAEPAAEVLAGCLGIAHAGTSFPTARRSARFTATLASWIL